MLVVRSILKRNNALQKTPNIGKSSLWELLEFLLPTETQTSFRPNMIRSIVRNAKRANNVRPIVRQAAQATLDMLTAAAEASPPAAPKHTVHAILASSTMLTIKNPNAHVTHFEEYQDGKLVYGPMYIVRNGSEPIDERMLLANTWQKIEYHTLRPLPFWPKTHGDLLGSFERPAKIMKFPNMFLSFCERRFRTQNPYLRAAWSALRQWACAEGNYTLNLFDRFAYTLKFFACITFRIQIKPVDFIINGHNFGPQYDECITVASFDGSGPIATLDGTDYRATEAHVGFGWGKHTWWTRIERISSL
jgi:hypothetical protein